MLAVRLNLPGETSSSLMIRGATAGSSGAYACRISNSAGVVVTNPARLTVQASGDPGRLVNLSVLDRAGQSQALKVGFVIGGAGTNGSVPVLLRGVGPSLERFGVSGVLADPVLTLYHGSSAVGENDNWSSSANNASLVPRANLETGAFAFTHGSSLDGALVTALVGGAYTVRLSGNGGTSGAALAEVYLNADASSYDVTTRGRMPRESRANPKEEGPPRMVPRASLSRLSCDH